MFLVGILSWWYGRGWLTQLRRIGMRFKSTLDFFSIGQLMATLFAPFRQISAGASGDTSIGGAFRSFIDQLISRIIGAFVRLGTIMVGVFAILFLSLYELVFLALWWITPVLPIIGAVLLAIGWVPTWK